MRLRLLALPALLALGLAGAPSANAMIIDGKDWRQLTETTGFSWLNVNSSCKTGVCSGSIGATLMDGWHWADNAEVAALFDALIKPGTTQFPTATTSYSAAPDADIANAVTSIFDPTSIFNLGTNQYREVRGLTHSKSGSTTTLAYLSDSPFVNGLDYAAFDTTYPTNLGDSTTGIWLYKPVTTPSPVPLPDSGLLTLLGAGLAALGGLRQRSVA